MKIQIEQAEIEQAVREYVANQGIKVEGKVLTLEFKMTRGEEGLLANLSIDEPAVAATPTKAVTKPRAGTVGAAIASQADKAEKVPVNKLPTSAAEAIADAKERASSELKPEAAPEPETGDAVKIEPPVPEAPEEVQEQKTTTSLFG